MKELLIIGASGHGKVIADIAVKSGKYDRITFYDDNEEIKSVLGFSCRGRIKQLEQEPKEKEVIVAIGNAAVRKRMQEWAEEMGFGIPVLVHPQAVIAEDVQLGDGTVVMAGAVVNSGTRIGRGVIVNTSCSVDHDCEVEDYAHISVGAHLAGTVFIGEGSWIGAGATVNNNVSICKDVMIGAGAVVVKNVTETGTYVGVPAQKLK